MQKLQDSVFSIIKTTNLSPAVFSFLQPKEEFEGMFTSMTTFLKIVYNIKQTVV